MKEGPGDPARARAFMEQALALAALGEGTTSPNPRVGCVLVRGSRPVGWGYHEAAGKCHAEARAVAMAGSRARGATLYVNLEPCAHHGRTPPCTDLLIAHGVRRVVASIPDPNPQVDGLGFRKLREAGVAVEVGLLAEQARLLNEPFLHWHATGRPLVTLKAAASLDGMLSAAGGSSRWITGEVARRVAHRLRFRHDAILVGAGTVRRDDPSLTVRLPGIEAPRQRVVLAPGLDLRPDARVLARPRGAGGAPTRVYTAREVSSAARSRLAGRAEIVRVEAPGGRLDLTRVLADLSRIGVQSVLVEGGARTLAGFLDAGLADRAALFLAPILLGARGGTPMLDLRTLASPGLAWRIDTRHLVPLSGDLLVLGRIVPPPHV